MLASDIRSLYESYQNIYEENDGISLELIEEVVEELIEECVEYGYTLDEAADTVENAALEYFEEQYLDEATVTYGSDTESPEQRRERAKAKVGEKKKAARKAAVKGAVERVKAKAKGAKAAAGIAGSIAKDEARRAARAAKQAVSSTAQKTKEKVKSGVKGLLGKGLRAAAGAAGSVAQKARKAGAAAGRAAERLGEESINEADSIAAMRARAAKRRQQRYGKQGGGGRDDFRPYTKADYERGEANDPRKKVDEEVDFFDVILEHLLDEGYADTNQAALVIMANMSEEWKEEILEGSYEDRIAANNKKYDRNRKRAAERAAARNAARDAGKTGAVPGVGYVTPRRERETYTDSSGKTRHAKGL